MSIHFSPYAHNVLDYIDVPLVSADGRNVIVRRYGMAFQIYVDGALYRETDVNISASYVLNSLECNVAKGGEE